MTNARISIIFKCLNLGHNLKGYIGLCHRIKPLLEGKYQCTVVRDLKMKSFREMELMEVLPVIVTFNGRKNL